MESRLTFLSKQYGEMGLTGEGSRGLGSPTSPGGRPISRSSPGERLLTCSHSPHQRS